MSNHNHKKNVYFPICKNKLANKSLTITGTGVLKSWKKFDSLSKKKNNKKNKQKKNKVIVTLILKESEKGKIIT